MFKAEGMKSLASAVLLQAMHDYKTKKTSKEAIRHKDSAKYFIESGQCDFWLDLAGISKRPYLEAMERDDTQSIKLPQKAHKKPIKSRKEKK